MLLPYLDFAPDLESPADVAADAAAIGRLKAGPGLVLRSLATLRADGEWIRVGARGWFGARATAHIADETLGATVGDDVTVGRFALVHACTLGDGVVVGDGATVMDGATVGAGSLVAAGSVVPPRKQLPGGFVYSGHPAAPVREIAAAELREAARAIRSGQRAALATADDVPPVDPTGFMAELAGIAPAAEDPPPRAGRAFLAPTALLVGAVEVADDAGVYFGCVLRAGGARIRVGRASNVQDNSLLLTDRTRGDLVLGDRVTIGHNVVMGSGVVEDDALVGMASRVGDGVVVRRGGCIAAGAWVEPGTVVEAGWIWAGRPARPFRELKPQERDAFAHGVDVYVRYANGYIAGAGARR